MVWHSVDWSARLTEPKSLAGRPMQRRRYSATLRRERWRSRLRDERPRWLRFCSRFDRRNCGVDRRDLRESGLAAEVKAISDTQDLAPYDAFVLGSAVHGGRWLPEAVAFVERHGSEMAGRPTWLFSVSSLGDQSSMFGPRVSRLLRRWRKAPRIAGFEAAAAPRGHHNFAGAIAKSDYGRSGRLFMFLLGGRFGDHRDRDEVDAWVREIAAVLATVSPTGGRA